MIAFDYHAPETLAEALALLAEHGDDARVVAGGTAVVLLLKLGLIEPGALVSLRQIAALRDVRVTAQGLAIGAMVSQRALERSADVQQGWPLLAEACGRVATPRIRTQATIGGGLAHGDPNQDSPTALVALDAIVHLVGAKGERRVPVEDFLVDYYQTDLRPAELVRAIELPRQPAGAGGAYCKLLTRSEEDYPAVSVAAQVVLDEAGERCHDVRLALGAVGPRVVRARDAEAALLGQRLTADTVREAAALARAAADPADDLRGSASYKRQMVGVLAEEALTLATERARATPRPR